MPMSIKNPEIERLAEELSRITKSSKTEVIRQALQEKKERLEVAGSAARRQRLAGLPAKPRMAQASQTRIQALDEGTGRSACGLR